MWGKEKGGGHGVIIQEVRTHKRGPGEGGQAKCVRLRTRGEGGSNFGGFCAYVLCG